MTCEYINKKNEIKEENSNPTTLMEINFRFLFFLETINWEIAKSNDKQSDRFPKDGTIN